MANEQFHIDTPQDVMDRLKALRSPRSTGGLGVLAASREAGLDRVTDSLRSATAPFHKDVRDAKKVEKIRKGSTFKRDKGATEVDNAIADLRHQYSLLAPEFPEVGDKIRARLVELEGLKSKNEEQDSNRPTGIPTARAQGLAKPGDPDPKNVISAIPGTQKYVDLIDKGYAPGPILTVEQVPFIQPPQGEGLVSEAAVSARASGRPPDQTAWAAIKRGSFGGFVSNITKGVGGLVEQVFEDVSPEQTSGDRKMVRLMQEDAIVGMAAMSKGVRGAQILNRYQDIVGFEPLWFRGTTSLLEDTRVQEDEIHRLMVSEYVFSRNEGVDTALRIDAQRRVQLMSNHLDSLGLPQSEKKRFSSLFKEENMNKLSPEAQVRYVTMMDKLTDDEIYALMKQVGAPVPDGVGAAP